MCGRNRTFSGEMCIRDRLKSLDSIMRNKVFKDVVSEIEKGSFMVYYQPKVDSRLSLIHILYYISKTNKNNYNI